MKEEPHISARVEVRDTSVSGAVSGMRIRPENSFVKLFVELARTHYLAFEKRLDS
jgi:hypothetical protein